MTENFADRLLQAIRTRKSPVCVGLDPVYSKLPPAIIEHRDFNDGDDSEVALDAVLQFCRKVIKVVGPIVPAVKINTAYFERFYGEGIDAYLELVQEAASADLLVIGDCKRGDVGHTAELYAKSQLADPDFDNLDQLTAPDAVTLHSYLGLDSLKPFLGIACEQGKGVFALVQTSNPSAAEVQEFTNSEGLTLSEHVGKLVNEWAGGAGLMGQSGFSALGAVVAPRNVETARRLREAMPNCLFLVPGYGAQGATAEDIANCFKPDGTGAIVNASRSVIYAYGRDEYQDQADNWEKCIELACQNFAADIAKAVGM